MTYVMYHMHIVCSLLALSGFIIFYNFVSVWKVVAIVHYIPLFDSVFISLYCLIRQNVISLLLLSVFHARFGYSLFYTSMQCNSNSLLAQFEITMFYIVVIKNNIGIFIDLKMSFLHPLRRIRIILRYTEIVTKKS